MVRAPTKTCPNLLRLFEEAEPELLAAFLGAPAFERLTWLKEYKFDSADPVMLAGSSDMIQREKKDKLGPLETEAARIVTIAGNRGQFALEGLARTKLGSERMQVLMNQRDDIARSLWAYTHEHALFEAAENSLHLRLYRRYDRHYQTFMADPAPAGGPNAGRDLLQNLLEELRAELDRGDGYDIDRFDIPADGEEPAAEMYLLFHPEPPTSVREIDEVGRRSRIYFRPPGEAMIVYTPSTGRVHVRARTRHLRHLIAENFIATVLEQPPSSQPVDFRAYDISRFFSDFELPTPTFEDVVILSAKVIRCDVSIGNLANRLSVSTTIEDDIKAVIENEPGLGKTFERAVAIRFVEIAVRYRRADREVELTLDFTLTDRNTSSLLSLDDPFERVLGHRLLREWGILREGRAPSDADNKKLMPALLALWDIGAVRVTGAWLLDRGIAPQILQDVGFLVPSGWEGDDVIDDEDAIGVVAAEVIVRPKGAMVAATEGQAAPGANPERYRNYRVRDGWVVQHLRTRLGKALDAPCVEELTPHLLYLGTLDIDAFDVPVYLVRGLDDENARAAIDTAIRARQDQGIGLVLQAGNVAGSCFATNVLTPILDHIDPDTPEIILAAESLKSAYRSGRGLARGGQTLELKRYGENAGKLFLPGKGSIDIQGENRLRVLDALIAAHRNGPGPVSTKELGKGMEGQSLANIFGAVLWNKLKADFVRSPGKGLWEIAA